ncbi:PQQ-binding-like beta-propeller repeat protein, partial [Planctomycetota bacterium]
MTSEKTCGTHPGEKRIGTCIQCGKIICRMCRESHGYFCSDECRLKTQEEEEDHIPKEDARRIAAIDARVSKGFRFAVRWILPAVLLVIIVVIVISCLSDAGELQWEFTPRTDRPFSPIEASYTNLFLACEEGTVYSVKKENGETAWHFKTEAKKCSESFPAYIPPDICIVWDVKHIYGLNSNSGKTKWTFTPEGKFHQNVLIDGKTVYFVTHLTDRITERKLSSLSDILAAKLL